MIFVQTPSRVLSRSALKAGRVPRRTVIHGIFAGPRTTIFSPVFWRLLFDFALVRYLLALLPFPIAAIIEPDLALPLTQAPLVMFAIVYAVEAHVLSISTPARRKRLIGEDEAAAALDQLALRGREILTRIAASRRLDGVTMHLVIDQSRLARVPPLSLVSVQVEGGDPEVMELDAAEIAMIGATLFDAERLSERLLHRVNLAQNTFFRAVPLDTATISAHARMSALLAEPA